MKNSGSDFKYMFYIVGAYLAALPIFLYEPVMLLVAIAVTLGGVGARQLHRYRGLAGWEKVDGEMIKTDIGEYKVLVGQYSYPDVYYFPLAYYSYSFKGEEYKSNKYCFDRKSVWSKSLDEIRRIESGLEAGKPVEVYVNPGNPGEAVLNIEVSSQRRSHSYALIVSGVSLVVVAGALWYYS